ncbi:MAG: LacI family DNA-binding transcriptional regulator [Oscillospiraceae bacterium]|jgi:LacI family transcriptional regulator|nr:LacI family DNA-binding transcriptional regulator [Oscillospiraceae bacterium]MDD3260830.1 LacI family DNA-binding transcriptional regulator [Oscillospiraceae bacterium]
MAVTIKQISELSGVSRGTVDRVLNSRGHVAPEKEALVRRVAEQLGYQPNMAGKALAARKKSYVIAVLLCSEGNPFFDEIIRGIRAAAEELTDFGVRVRLYTCKGYDDASLAEKMRSLPPDFHALVLTPVNRPAVLHEINALTKAGKPVVTINTDIEGSSRVCYVGSNYTAGGRLACGALRLITGGQAHLGIVSGSRQLLGHAQRIAGFCTAMRQNCPGFQVIGEIATEDDDIIGYSNAKHLLRDHPEIDALFLSAAGTYGVCRAVEEVRPGNAPKIVCFDTTPQVREFLEQGFIQAVIDQQPYRQGYEAVQAAYRNLLTGEVPASGRILMDNQIRITESFPSDASKI